MANIRTESNRHDWQAQRLFNSDHPLSDDRGFAMGLLCINCRQPWFPDLNGSPESTGCRSDVKIQNLGQARQKDLMQYAGEFEE